MTRSKQARRPRNPVAKAVRSPQYRMRTEPDKRQKLVEVHEKRVRKSREDES